MVVFERLQIILTDFVHDVVCFSNIFGNFLNQTFTQTGTFKYNLKKLHTEIEEFKSPQSADLLVHQHI